MFIFTYQSKYPPLPPLPHTTTCTGHAYQSVGASTSAFGPFFLSSFLRGEKSSKKSVMKTRQHHRRRDGAAAPATSSRKSRTTKTTTASLVFHGTVRPFVPSETAVQPAVRISSSLRRVLDAFLSLSFEHHHHLLLHIVKSRFGRLESFFHALKVSCFPMCGVNSRYHHHHHLSLYIYIKEAYGFAGAVLSAVLFLGHLSLLFFSSPDDDDSDDDALARVVRFVTRCAVAAPLWGTFAVVFYVVAVECLSRARVFDVSDERLLSQKKSSSSSTTMQAKRRRRKRGDGGHDAGVFAAGECADAREWNEALFSPPPRSG